MTTRLEAKEEIHALARRLIDEATAEVLGIVLADERKMRDGLEEADIPIGGYYTRTKVRTLVENRLVVGITQLPDATAASWENIGDMCIQVFGAKAEDDALHAADMIADALKRRFNERRSDSPTSSLVFNEVRVKDDLPAEKQWFQVQMWARWECEELRRVATG